MHPEVELRHVFRPLGRHEDGRLVVVYLRAEHIVGGEHQQNKSSRNYPQPVVGEQSYLTANDFLLAHARLNCIATGVLDFTHASTRSTDLLLTARISLPKAYLEKPLQN